jgi:hypothetical protein
MELGETYRLRFGAGTSVPLKIRAPDNNAVLLSLYSVVSGIEFYSNDTGFRYGYLGVSSQDLQLISKSAGSTYYSPWSGYFFFFFEGKELRFRDGFSFCDDCDAYLVFANPSERYDLCIDIKLEQSYPILAVLSFLGFLSAATWIFRKSISIYSRESSCFWFWNHTSCSPEGAYDRIIPKQHGKLRLYLLIGPITSYVVHLALWMCITFCALLVFMILRLLPGFRADYDFTSIVCYLPPLYMIMFFMILEGIMIGIAFVLPLLWKNFKVASRYTGLGWSSHIGLEDFVKYWRIRVVFSLVYIGCLAIMLGGLFAPIPTSGTVYNYLFVPASCTPVNAGAFEDVFILVYFFYIPLLIVGEWISLHVGSWRVSYVESLIRCRWMVGREGGGAEHVQEPLCVIITMDETIQYDESNALSVEQSLISRISMCSQTRRARLTTLPVAANNWTTLAGAANGSVSLLTAVPCWISMTREDGMQLIPLGGHENVPSAGGGRPSGQSAPSLLVADEIPNVSFPGPSITPTRLMAHFKDMIEASWRKSWNGGGSPGRLLSGPSFLKSLWVPNSAAYGHFLPCCLRCFDIPFQSKYVFWRTNKYTSSLPDDFSVGMEYRTGRGTMLFFAALSFVFSFPLLLPVVALGVSYFLIFCYYHDGFYHRLARARVAINVASSIVKLALMVLVFVFFATIVLSTSFLVVIVLIASSLLALVMIELLGATVCMSMAFGRTSAYLTMKPYEPVSMLGWETSKLLGSRESMLSPPMISPSLSAQVVHLLESGGHAIGGDRANPTTFADVSLVLVLCFVRHRVETELYSIAVRNTEADSDSVPDVPDVVYVSIHPNTLQLGWREYSPLTVESLD